MRSPTTGAEQRTNLEQILLIADFACTILGPWRCKLEPDSLFATASLMSAPDQPGELPEQKVTHPVFPDSVAPVKLHAAQSATSCWELACALLLQYRRLDEHSTTQMSVICCVLLKLQNAQEATSVNASPCSNLRRVV